MSTTKQLYYIQEKAVSTEFVMESGDCWSFENSFLVRHFCDSERTQIILYFAEYTVDIRGKQLGNLFNHLRRHSVDWVRTGSFEGKEGVKEEITSINIEQMTDEEDTE